MKRLSVPERVARRGVEAVSWLCLAAATALGQEDLTLPPRLDGVPYQARLAAQPEERDDSLEEVIVTSDNEWRLPDLGSTWRVRQEQNIEQGRIQARFMPLYDPEDPATPVENLFPVNHEMQRVGFIQLFRLRFGGRDTD